MQQGPGAGLFRGGLVVGHPGSQDPVRLGIEAQALRHVQVGAHQRGVVGVAQGVVGYSGLLDLKMLHGAGQGLLVLVAAGLQVVDQLQIDPAFDPVPIQVVDDDVLLQDPLVVAAPGQEGDPVAAPLPKAGQGFGKAHAVCKTVLIKAGDLLHLVVHAPEVNGLHIDGEFLGWLHVLIQLHGADLDDLAPQMDGQLIKDGGFGAHGLVPLQIHHNIIHKSFLFVSKFTVTV